MSKPTTLNKKVYHFKDIQDKIVNAVNMIADPIRQTMSPRGGNVIYEDQHGVQHLTNDGVTIAKNLFVKDPVENAIIEIIKGSSLQTNMIAGDGTSSTILQASVLIKEGLRLVDSGKNQIEVRDTLNKFGEELVSILEKDVKKISNDKDLQYIALVSSGNDEEISTNVVEVVKFAGKDGQVIIEPSYTEKTEIVKESGFTTRNPVFSPELLTERGSTMYKDVPVLVTDKRLYYQAEAETILKTILDAGYRDVVVVASDFLNESLPFFIANHKGKTVNVLLVKEEDPELLKDIAVYLGTELISDKTGSIVDGIEINDFALAKSVFGDTRKVILTRADEKNKNLDARIKMLREELDTIGDKKSMKYEMIEKRIASLTRGMATLKIGGRTPVEANERIYRYEDAINATRVAMEEGYLVGGGVAMFNALSKIDSSKYDIDYHPLFAGVCSANIKQIIENAGGNRGTLSEVSSSKYKNYGFNALTGKVEDLLKAGIIEPFVVTKNVIKNAISIANIIISSRYLMVNDIEDEE